MSLSQCINEHNITQYKYNFDESISNICLATTHFGELNIQKQNINVYKFPCDVMQHKHWFIIAIITNNEKTDVVINLENDKESIIAESDENFFINRIVNGANVTCLEISNRLDDNNVWIEMLQNNEICNVENLNYIIKLAKYLLYDIFNYKKAIYLDDEAMTNLGKGFPIFLNHVRYLGNKYESIYEKFGFKIQYENRRMNLINKIKEFEVTHEAKKVHLTELFENFSGKITEDNIKLIRSYLVCVRQQGGVKLLKEIIDIHQKMMCPYNSKIKTGGSKIKYTLKNINF
jgi:hypothetical protein